MKAIRHEEIQSEEQVSGTPESSSDCAKDSSKLAPSIPRPKKRNKDSLNVSESSYREDTQFTHSEAQP